MPAPIITPSPRITSAEVPNTRGRRWRALVTRCMARSTGSRRACTGQNLPRRRRGCRGADDECVMDPCRAGLPPCAHGGEPDRPADQVAAAGPQARGRHPPHGDERRRHRGHRTRRAGPPGRRPRRRRRQHGHRDHRSGRRDRAAAPGLHRAPARARRHRRDPRRGPVRPRRRRREARRASRRGGDRTGAGHRAGFRHRRHRADAAEVARGPHLREGDRGEARLPQADGRASSGKG